MAINTKTRSDLKSYFVKNAIPTQGNFADLIDAQLNQADDGVFKQAGEPLSLVAAEGDQKRVLRLYTDYGSANPDWLISLKPQDPGDASTNRAGFGIADGAGRTRLFIDSSTGNLGVGTTSPGAKLDVNGGELKISSDGQGISFYGDARIYKKQGGGLKIKAHDDTAGIEFLKADNSTSQMVIKDGNVGIGTTSPTQSLHVRGNRADNDGLTIENPGAGNPQLRFVDSEAEAAFSLKKGWEKNGHSGLELWDGAEKVINVREGNVGIGTQDPAAKLEVAGTIKATESITVLGDVSIESNRQILFADNGEIRSRDNNHRILFRPTENKLELREYGDIILSPGATASQETAKVVFRADGNVGIGTTKPSEKLTVEGRIKTQYLTLGQWPASPSYVFFGNNKLDQNISDNYALLQDSDKGRTFLNSPQDIRFRISNADKMVLAGNGDVAIHGKLFLKGIREEGFNDYPFVLVNTASGELTKSKASNSDLRLKEDVTPISGALSKMMALRGVSYRWNEEGLNQKTKGVEKRMRSENNDAEDNEKIWAAARQRIRQENAGAYKGFIAQEVEEIFPEWVKEDKDGYKTLDTSELLPVLVEAVKEQQKHISEQQQLIEKSATRLDILERK